MLATIIAMIATSTQLAAVVTLRLAHNAEQRDRAFEAAEHAVQAALGGAPLATTYTPEAPLVFPALPAATAPVPDGNGDGFAYRLHYLGRRAAAGDDGLPGMEFHFAVEATGVTPSGATDTHVQGFFVRREAGWVSDAAEPCEDACAPAVAAPPQRTFWLQSQAE
jgi:hypothetical protein